MDEDVYGTGALITGVIAFCGIWWYCATEYDFLGFALGWMPAAIIGGIIGFLWPLVVVVIAVAVIFFFK